MSTTTATSHLTNVHRLHVTRLHNVAWFLAGLAVLGIAYRIAGSIHDACVHASPMTDPYMEDWAVPLTWYVGGAIGGLMMLPMLLGGHWARFRVRMYQPRKRTTIYAANAEAVQRLIREVNAINGHRVQITTPPPFDDGVWFFGISFRV